MKNIIHIEAPDGKKVTVILKNNMFYIGEDMFLFVDFEGLIDVAHQYLEKK